MGLVETLFTSLTLFSVTEVVLGFLSILLGVLYFVKQQQKASLRKGIQLPPVIPHTVPFVGSAISFGTSPISFLHEAYKKHGPVFSLDMFGSTCTYLVGSEAAGLIFNSKNDEMNAEEVYGNLTIPVFGPNVVYDCSHAEFCEQKRIMKTGLTQARFQEYVGLIEEETRTYMKRFQGEGELDLFECLSELIIMTASRCLLGPEIRSKLDESVAQLYSDLDGGFTPAAWLLPSWLPLPSFRKRDRAHTKLKKVFKGIIEKRRADNRTEETDMLATFMNGTYRNGRQMTDEQVSGMCIAMLLAGQHTSSTTSSWLGFYLTQNPEMKEKCRAEGAEILKDGYTYDKIKKLDYLDNVLKETLRLRPPIMTMMRMCKKPQKINGYTIPEGHMICVSPTVNHIIDESWEFPQEFKPERFVEKSVVENVDSTTGAQNGVNRGKFSYVPFGAGYHRCVGELFAYLQIKTIWSVLFEEFDFERESLPEINYTTMIHTPMESTVKYKRVN